MPITRPPIIQKPFAESGDKNTIPLASQVGITDGAASFVTGFPPDTMIDIGAGGIAPDGLDMNGILNIITQHIRFWLAGGYPRFDGTLCAEIGGYPVGTILQDNNGVNLYRNVLENNTSDFNVLPGSIGVSWIWLTGQTRSIVAGTGLVGGGKPATADVYLNMGTPGTCSAATTNAATADSHTHALTLPDPGWVTAGNGLTGGGDLPGNVTLNMGTPGTVSLTTTNSVSTDSHTHGLSIPASSGSVVGITRYAFEAEAEGMILNNVALTPGGLGRALVDGPTVKKVGKTVFETGLSGPWPPDTNVTFTFPEAFSSDPVVVPYIKNSSLTNDDVFPRVISVTSTQVVLRLESTTGALSSVRYIGYLAIGTIN